MSLLGNLMSAVGGNNQQATLLSLASSLVEKAGGIQGLLNLLAQHGLGDAVQSWIGTGANKSISGPALGSALDAGGLGALVEAAAGKLGTQSGPLLGQLAQMLPGVVDHLTPDGKVPEGKGGLDLGALAGLAGKLLG